MPAMRRCDRQRGRPGTPEPAHHPRRGRALRRHRPNCARRCGGHRIAELRDELDVNIKQAYLIVNRVQGQLTPALQAAVDKVGIPLAGIIPSDPQVTQMDADGQALVELPDNAIIFRAISAIAQATLSMAVVADQ